MSGGSDEPGTCVVIARPNIETIIVEKPAPHGPFGARGVGEPPIVPAPAAIANAIEDATGVRLTHLPLSSERIALAIASA